MRLILVIAGALLLSSPVMAGTKTKHVKCASKDGDFKRCKVSGIKKISNMSVKKRYSDSKCKKGYSYGYDKKSIWVDHGCRAKFNVRYKKSSSSKYKTKSVKCSSKDHDFKRCRVKHAKKIKNMSVKKLHTRLLHGDPAVIGQHLETVAFLSLLVGALVDPGRGPKRPVGCL